MSNRFEHITSKPRRSQVSSPAVSQCETKPARKPKQHRISKEAYQTLMSLLATVPETPDTSHGVYVANGTKRNLQLQVRELFSHD